jgi:predicted kinase
MSLKKIIILKGISGSGKSTVAELFSEPKTICCADDYYVGNDGVYRFNGEEIGKAHQACKDKFLRHIDDPVITNIIISNTNTKPSDYQFYIDEAEKRGISVIHLVVEKRHDNDNLHGTPDHVIQRQYNNLKSNIKLI